MNGNGNMMNADKDVLMKKLTEVDFAIHEAVLHYLLRQLQASLYCM